MARSDDASGDGGNDAPGGGENDERARAPAGSDCTVI
jgi:hypothetical protein